MKLVALLVALFGLLLMLQPDFIFHINSGVSQENKETINKNANMSTVTEGHRIQNMTTLSTELQPSAGYTDIVGYIMVTSASVFFTCKLLI